MKPLAVYTTVYPGVEAFLPDWLRSLRDQEDDDFRLWIGLDAVTPEAVMEAMGGDPDATWVSALPGDTPGQVRQRALERMVESSIGVVLVDSDDVLHPNRVAWARDALTTSDLTACALRIIDERGRDTGRTFGYAPDGTADAVLPRNNIFGFSNSAYRSGILQQCMPIPASAELVDWFLATVAWLHGARLASDRRVGMDYRQHDANTARILGPFTGRQVLKDTERVRHHFCLLWGLSVDGVAPERLAELERASADVEAFYRLVVLQPAHLERYVRALNTLDFSPLWWACVAHPALRHLWAPERSSA